MEACTLRRPLSHVTCLPCCVKPVPSQAPSGIRLLLPWPICRHRSPTGLARTPWRWPLRKEDGPLSGEGERRWGPQCVVQCLIKARPLRPHQRHVPEEQDRGPRRAASTPLPTKHRGPGTIEHGGRRVHSLTPSLTVRIFLFISPGAASFIFILGGGAPSIRIPRRRSTRTT